MRFFKLYGPYARTQTIPKSEFSTRFSLSANRESITLEHLDLELKHLKITKQATFNIF